MESINPINDDPAKGDSPSNEKVVNAKVGDIVRLSDCTMNCPMDLTASRWATVEQLCDVTPSTITSLPSDNKNLDRQKETNDSEGKVAPALPPSQWWAPSGSSTRPNSRPQCGRPSLPCS